MRKTLLVAGVILGLALLGLWIGTLWLHSFIRSDAFRHEVETRAAQTLGGPVEIKTIDFSIWSGVKLDGLAAKFDSSQGALALQVESVHCSYSILAVLSRRLELKGVTLVKPQIVLTQQPAAAVPVPPVPPVPAASAAHPPTAREATSGKTAPFQFVLRAAKIDDGRLSIRDAAGATKADLQGVQIHANTSGYYEGKDVTGTVRIATVALPQNLQLTDFSTPFTYRAGAAGAGPFEAAAFSGRLTGDYKLPENGASLLQVNAVRLDMLQIGKTANPNSSTRLSGALALQSRWTGVETGKLAGEGDAQISDGKLTGVALLHDLAIALRISGLSEPDLHSVTVHFQVANGSTRFTNLRIESDVFEMTGQGIIDPQGRLSADMVLTLHGGAMGVVPGAVSSFFSRLPGGGGSIPFHLSGTVGSPQADLSTRLFLQGSHVEKTINKAINRFFH